MTFAEVMQLIQTGGVAGLATIVYLELRQIRPILGGLKEMMAVALDRKERARTSPGE